MIKIWRDHGNRCSYSRRSGFSISSSCHVYTSKAFELMIANDLTRFITYFCFSNFFSFCFFFFWIVFWSYPMSNYVFIIFGFLCCFGPCTFVPKMLLRADASIVLVTLRNIAWLGAFVGLSIVYIWNGRCSTVRRVFVQSCSVPISSGVCVCWPLSAFFIFTSFLS